MYCSESTCNIFDPKSLCWVRLSQSIFNYRTSYQDMVFWVCHGFVTCRNALSIFWTPCYYLHSRHKRNGIKALVNPMPSNHTVSFLTVWSTHYEQLFSWIGFNTHESNDSFKAYWFLQENVQARIVILIYKGQSLQFLHKTVLKPFEHSLYKKCGFWRTWCYQSMS